MDSQFIYSQQLPVRNSHFCCPKLLWFTGVSRSHLCSSHAWGMNLAGTCWHSSAPFKLKKPWKNLYSSTGGSLMTRWPSTFWPLQFLCFSACGGVPVIALQRSGSGSSPRSLPWCVTLNGWGSWDVVLQESRVLESAWQKCCSCHPWRWITSIGSLDFRFIGHRCHFLCDVLANC